jgi:hypothetical protein
LYHYEQWYQRDYPSLFHPSFSLIPSVSVVQTIPSHLSFRLFFSIRSQMLYFGWITAYVLSNLYQYYHLQRPPFLS